MTDSHNVLLCYRLTWSEDVSEDIYTVLFVSVGMQGMWPMTKWSLEQTCSTTLSRSDLQATYRYTVDILVHVICSVCTVIAYLFIWLFLYFPLSVSVCGNKHVSCISDALKSERSQ